MSYYLYSLSLHYQPSIFQVYSYVLSDSRNSNVNTYQIDYRKYAGCFINQ